MVKLSKRQGEVVKVMRRGERLFPKREGHGRKGTKYYLFGERVDRRVVYCLYRNDVISVNVDDHLDPYFELNQEDRC